MFSSNPSIASGSHELYLGHRFVGIPRIRSTGAEPIYFGSYLLAALPLVGVSLRRQHGFARTWRAAAFGLGSVCLVMTFSRGVYLGVFALLVLVVIGMWRGLVPRPTRRQALVVGVASIAALALGVSILVGRAPWELPLLLVDRMRQSFASHDMSNMTRIYAWRAALACVWAQPWTGVGWEGFGFHYYNLSGAEAAGAHFGWPVTNNLPLRIAAESGFLGLVAWGWAVWPSMSAALLRRIHSDRYPLTFVMASLVLAALVQNMTLSQLQLPHLWLLGGSSAAIALSRNPVV
jgi:O-antigen ligase